jgi:hypothetical protein
MQHTSALLCIVSYVAGVTYDRSAISTWLRAHDASPVTRQPLPNKMLTPNVALRSAILHEIGYGGQMGGPGGA